MLRPISYLFAPDRQIRTSVINTAQVKLNSPAGNSGLQDSGAAFADTSLKIHGPEKQAMQTRLWQAEGFIRCHSSREQNIFITTKQTIWAAEIPVCPHKRGKPEEWYEKPGKQDRFNI